MRLLLTRAAEDAARTRARLEASGHTVLVSPVIEMVTLEAAWPTGIVEAVLATSSHAFACFRGEGLPSREVRRLMPLLLVGGRTDEGARSHGFHGEAVIAANASSLAVQIGELPRKPRRIVYLAGRDRKPDIERALRMTGQPVEIIETYMARAKEHLDMAVNAALRAARLDGVLHYSRRSALLFTEQTQKAGLDIRPVSHFCLSEDIAKPLKEARCKVIVAEAPNEAALLACLDPVPAQASTT